jgi:hypothetical protein
MRVRIAPKIVTRVFQYSFAPQFPLDAKDLPV